jgi:hypothetical protein
MGYPKQINQLDPGVGQVPKSFEVPARDPGASPALRWTIDQLTPSWDDVLSIGHETSQLWAALALVDSYVFENAIPDNYNVGLGQGLFSRWIESNFVNPVSGRKDVVGSFWSYNLNPGSSVIIPGEAAFGFKTETFYEQDGTQLMEFHLPEIVDNTGVAHRIWSMYSHRPDGFTYLQSQLGSLSFRPSYDNTGASEWMSIFSGGTVGAIDFTLNAALGSGGATGDQSNFCRLIFIDGTGANARFQMVGGEFGVISNRWTENCTQSSQSSQTKFNQGNVFGDNQTYLECISAAPGKGYQFYNAGQAILLMALTDSAAQISAPTLLLGNAAKAPLRLQVQAIDPTDTATPGQIFTDGTNFYTYIAGVKKTFTLI